MRIGLVQLDIEWENQAHNHRKAAKLIEKAAESGSGLVCLPELFSTGVSLDSGKFAEADDGATCSFLKEQARLHGIYLVGSFIEENDRHLPLNASVAFDPKGRIIAKYHKAHLFMHGGEDMGYSPGKPEAVVFKAGGFKICPIVCYDLRFPESFLAGLDRGADLFIVQADWPNPRKPHWDALLQARAIECQAYVAGVNQAGKSPKNTFFGASKIIDPKGEIIAEADDKEGVIIADISADEVKENRRKYPFLKERRKIVG